MTLVMVVDDDQDEVVHNELFQSLGLQGQEGRPVAVECHDDDRSTRIRGLVGHLSRLVLVLACRASTAL